MRRWMGLALMIVGMGQAPHVLAQHLPYSAPAPMPEPVPCAPSQQPMVPGPITPKMAPPGPGDDLYIPAGIPGAFSECWYVPEKKVYFHIGAQALSRRRPGHLPIAFLDPNPLDTILRPSPVPPLTLDLSAVNPNYSWGPRGTIGLLYDSCALEATGYYLPETTNSVFRFQPGRLALLFHNPPLGFEGNNNLWSNADRVRVSLGTTLANAEVNTRWFQKALSGFDCTVGLRYFDMQERLGIFTDDDVASFPNIFGRPDPARQALYQSRVHNRIVAAQLGVEYQQNACCWLALGWWGKAAGGVNFYETDTSLWRGDGAVGFNGARNHTIYSGLFDMAGFAELHLLERLRIRMGYNCLWLVHVPIAQQQLDFNLANINGRRKDNGSVFYHGPLIEMQFLF